MNNKTFFSSGKVILSGEHSVVYGEPALVSAIDLGIEAFVVDAKMKINKKKLNDLGFDSQKKGGYLSHIFKFFKKKYFDQNHNIDGLTIYVKSNLPKKSGLGSSAAFAHVVFLCLLDYFDIELSQEKIFRLVKKAEKYVHGTPSGADPAAVVFGGVQVFRNGERKKSINNANLNFTLVNSGKPAETTGEMIDLVRSNKNTPGTIKRIGKVTTKMIESIGDWKFNPRLLAKNQRLLEELGVVGEKAKKLIKKIESLGGFAKITGAGGIKNGSGWLLVYHPNKDALNSFLTKNTMENYKIEVK